MEVDTIKNILILNAVCVWLIEVVKRSRYFPWVTQETEQINKMLSAFLAALSSAGITVVTINQGPGNLDIHITGLTLPTLLHFVWHGLGNYAVQKWVYKMVVPHVSSPEVRAAPTHLDSAAFPLLAARDMKMGKVSPAT